MLRRRCHFASWFNVGEIYKSYKVHHSLNPCNTAEKSFVNSTIHPPIHYQIWIKKKIAMYTTWGSQIFKNKKSSQSLCVQTLRACPSNGWNPALLKNGCYFVSALSYVDTSVRVWATKTQYTLLKPLVAATSSISTRCFFTAWHRGALKRSLASVRSRSSIWKYWAVNLPGFPVTHDDYCFQYLDIVVYIDDLQNIESTTEAFLWWSCAINSSGMHFGLKHFLVSWRGDLVPVIEILFVGLRNKAYWNHLAFI